MTVEFWITTLVVVATPGTGVIYTIAAGLARGSRAGILAAFACTLGIIPHMLAAITGLAALLYASSLAFEVIKYAGVAYLLYLAWKTWRSGFRVREVPITFTEREVGRSKMSRAIVIEALWRVAGWGLTSRSRSARARALAARH